MDLKKILLAGALLVPAGIASADPPVSTLTAVRLHLTTTTIRLDHTYSSTTVGGVVHRRVSIQPLEYTLPAKAIDGYILRTNFDSALTISTATKPDDLVSDGRVFFYLESELVKIKHTRPALVSTNLQYLFFPSKLISKVEPRIGPHNGYSGYGEPFYMPAWQAALLSSKDPIASCTQPSERNELDWVSYNERVGETELKHICDPVTSGPPTLQDLLLKGNVFGVVYPAD